MVWLASRVSTSRLSRSLRQYRDAFTVRRQGKYALKHCKSSEWVDEHEKRALCGMGVNWNNNYLSQRQLLARSDRVKCLDLHPKEPWMLASLYNGNVHVWNHENQTLTKSFEVTDLPGESSQCWVRSPSLCRL